MTQQEHSWIKLDNAAKIYPAAKTSGWTALFRVSATLTQPVDPAILAQAQQSTLRRFSSFAYRLRSGAFWYYLEKLDGAPEIQPDVANPCVRMNLRENGGFMFRVRYHENRIAVEIFHVLADGTGGLCFLKTLVAEYLRLKYGADIPRDNEILDCSQSASPQELEDSFTKYARALSMSRSETAAYHVEGTPNEKHFLSVICGMLDARQVKRKAAEYGVTVTEFLAAHIVMAIYSVSRRDTSRRRRLKPVKIAVPVNLRRFYPTRTMRNFSSYVNPGIEPRYGRYTFAETAKLIHHYLGLEITEKKLNAKFTTNVLSERNPVLRVTPLFLKNAVMKLVYEITGDRLSSTTLSNLGVAKLPEQMAQYVARMEFILGPLKHNPVTAACLTYNNLMCLNFSSTIMETDIQREVFTSLVKSGIHVKIESNQRY